MPVTTAAQAKADAAAAAPTTDTPAAPVAETPAAAPAFAPMAAEQPAPGTNVNASGATGDAAAGSWLKTGVTKGSAGGRRYDPDLGILVALSAALEEEVRFAATVDTTALTTPAAVQAQMAKPNSADYEIRYA